MDTKEKRADQANLLAPYGKLSPGPGRLPSDVAFHQISRIHRAMIDIVVERGYEAVKARDVVRLAGVSTRSFYEHFASKEDCFIQAYELLTRRGSQRIIAAQADERDWRKRLQRIFAAFARELEADPGAARLALVEVHTLSPLALERVWRAERGFETMIAESLARQPGGIEVPLLLVEGMVAGVMSVARARLKAGREKELSQLCDEVMIWLLSFPDESTKALAELDMRSVGGNGKRRKQIRRSKRGSGDRSLILAAITKLVAADAYTNLTIPRIRSAAGISRRKFENNFEGVEDCFVAALEEHASIALIRSAAAHTASRSWPGGIYRAIDALCEEVANDPFLANICITDSLLFGPNASRCRQRLAGSVVEQLHRSVPQKQRFTGLMVEASAGAIWSLFRRYVGGDLALERPRVPATLAYMALAPVIGGSAATAAIRGEQDSSPWG